MEARNGRREPRLAARSDRGSGTGRVEDGRSDRSQDRHVEGRNQRTRVGLRDMQRNNQAALSFAFRSGRRDRRQRKRRLLTRASRSRAGSLGGQRLRGWIGRCCRHRAGSREVHVVAAGCLGRWRVPQWRARASARAKSLVAGGFARVSPETALGFHGLRDGGKRMVRIKLAGSLLKSKDFRSDVFIFFSPESIQALFGNAPPLASKREPPCRKGRASKQGAALALVASKREPPCRKGRASKQGGGELSSRFFPWRDRKKKIQALPDLRGASGTISCCCATPA